MDIAISQLEQALEEKDNAKMRIRVEILLDFLRQTQVKPQAQAQAQIQPQAQRFTPNAGMCANGMCARPPQTQPQAQTQSATQAQMQAQARPQPQIAPDGKPIVKEPEQGSGGTRRQIGYSKPSMKR